MFVNSISTYLYYLFYGPLFTVEHKIDKCKKKLSENCVSVPFNKVVKRKKKIRDHDGSYSPRQAVTDISQPPPLRLPRPRFKALTFTE